MAFPNLNFFKSPNRKSHGCINSFIRSFFLGLWRRSIKLLSWPSSTMGKLLCLMIFQLIKCRRWCLWHWPPREYPKARTPLHMLTLITSKEIIILQVFLISFLKRHPHQLLMVLSFDLEMMVENNTFVFWIAFFPDHKLHFHTDMPIARKASLHRFLEKRKDR